MPKPRGYHYQIVEMFPSEEADHSIRELLTYDNLEDAEKVLECLQSVNYNFTCYGIMLRPVWETKVDAIRDIVSKIPSDFITATGELHGWDANGSPVTECDHSGSTSWVTTTGESGFHCPKCGKSTRTDPWI